MTGQSVVRRLLNRVHRTSPRRRSRPKMHQPEALEQRCLLAASSLSAADQFMLELMNRARANPSAEASRQGISLNQGLAAGTISTTPKQPLAPNNLLDDAADGHTADMFARNFFRHTSPNPGSTEFTDRITATGYSYTVAGENLALQQYTTLNQQTVTQQLHNGLYGSANHRVNLFNDSFFEAGNGTTFGNYTDGDGVVGGGTAPAGLVTVKFGARAEKPFITGVVYTDATSGANNDSFYSIGEAAGAGGTVTATNVSTGAVVTEIVGAAGGYSLQVPAGTYNVTVSGGGLAKTYGVSDVVVSSANVKVDFETTTAQEAAIVLAAPTITTGHQTKTQDQRFTLDWDAVSGANRYEVTYTRASSRTANYVNEFVTGTSFTPSSDLPIDRYHIWVRVAGTDGASSPWSSPITVHVNTAPTISSMDLNQTTTRPTISWTSVSGAATYEVWASNSTTEESPAFGFPQLTATSTTLSTDLPMGVYFVWVRALDEGGVLASWSTNERFQIGPQLSSPTAPTFDTTPQFSWTASTGSDTYQLYVTQGSTVVINESGIKGTTYTHSTALGSGDHRWWIRPFAANGRAGGWTEVGTFNVEGKPIITAPSGTTSSGSPVISWAPVSGAGSYEIYLYDLSSGSLVLRQRDLVGTSFSSPALADGNYRVWVKSYHTNGTDGSWSRPQDFTVDAATVSLPVTLTSPLTPVLDTTPEFQWNAAAGAASYDLYLHNGTTGILESGISGTTFTPTTPLADGSWQWWVRAVSASGAIGQWSSVAVTDVSGRPVLVAPAGTVSDTTPTFQWTAVIGAARYVIQVDNLSTGTSAVIREDNVSSNSYTPTTPLAAGNYRFWIQAVGSTSTNRSPWSFAGDFTIAAIDSKSEFDSQSEFDPSDVRVNLASLDVELFDQERSQQAMAGEARGSLQGTVVRDAVKEASPKRSTRSDVNAATDAVMTELTTGSLWLDDRRERVI